LAREIPCRARLLLTLISVLANAVDTRPGKFLKAIRIYHHGGAEQLRYEEAADPQLHSANDVIVRLEAAAVNNSDIQVRDGLDGKRVCLPRILGSDGAGAVAAVGTAVKDIKIGDAVCLYPQDGCARCRACQNDQPYLCENPQRLGEQTDGTYAEFVRVHQNNCFLLPAGLAAIEAAAIPVASLSAWRMLMTDAQLKPGESILIRSIGSAIATAALQLALSVGAHVIVTADNAEPLSRAIRMGAAYGIDERHHEFALEVRNLTDKRGVDVVVDCLGGQGWPNSIAALARDGRLVTCGASAGTQPVSDLRRIFWHHLKVFGSTLGSRDELRRVLNYMSANRIKPIIDKVFPLADAAAAQQRLAEAQVFGKIILSITSSASAN